MFVVHLNLSVQDLGYGTVQKRYRGGAYRNSHLSTDSTSPTTSRVCFSPFYINNIIIYVTIITGWVVALTCYISHSAKHRKMADFDPSGRQNP